MAQMILLCLLSLFSCSEKTSEPFAQELAELETLLEGPEKSKQICAQTQFKNVAEQCKKLKQRPHLYRAQKRKKRGTTKYLLSYNSPLISNFVQSSCTKGDSSCMLKKAHQAKSQEERAGHCHAIENDIWRDECFFEVAEQGFKSKKLSYAHAADLCTLAKSFVFSCLQHLSIVMVDHTQSLEGHGAHVQSIQGFWTSRDTRISKDMTEIYWVTALDIFISSQSKLDNRVFLLLPAESQPYVWSSIARKIVQQSTQKKSISEWTERLILWKEGKIELSFSKKRSRVHNNAAGRSSADLRSFKTVLYADQHRRILGETLEEEIAISLLFSASLYQKNAEWTEELKEHPSPRIQATR